MIEFNEHMAGIPQRGQLARRQQVGHGIAVVNLAAGQHAEAPALAFAISVGFVQPLPVQRQLEGARFGVGVGGGKEQRYAALHVLRQQGAHLLRRFRAVVQPPQHVLMQIRKAFLSHLRFALLPALALFSALVLLSGCLPASP